jgi:hypothetical protein
MLKVHDRKKALLYVVPMNGAFKVSMAIRETEKETLAADADVALLQDAIALAKKHAEGYALRFDVKDKASWDGLHALVEKLIDARTG